MLLTIAMPFLRDVRQPLNTCAKSARPFLVLRRMFVLSILEYKKNKHYQLCTLHRRLFYSSFSRLQPLWGTNKPWLPDTTLSSEATTKTMPTPHVTAHTSLQNQGDETSKAELSQVTWYGKHVVSPCPSTTDIKPSLMYC